jgi:hypothetical protein
MLARLLPNSATAGRDGERGDAMTREKIADAAAAVSWGLFGMSFAQINELLQFVALVLTILATGITIVIHLRKWLRK